MSMMIFIFLCFTGLFFMFFFILRSQEKMAAALREEMTALRGQLHQMEARLSDDNPLPVTTAVSPAMGALDSLSMGSDSSSAPADSGLDLHFDTMPRR